MISGPGPDFLCIGAPKTGTTWLYKHLSAHPDIWLPPVKELHYFDRRFPLPKAGDKVAVRKGLFGLFPRHDQRKIVRVVARGAVRASPAEIKWAIRYFSGPETDEWYCSLFQPAGRRISGELTTDYCALSADGVRHVRDLLPDVKIIFMMRDPIDRAWSHARMLLPQLLGKPLNSISTEEFVNYLTHPGPRARGDYLRTLQNWENAFPPAQIFVGFYEDVSRRPQAVLEQLLRFLGASTTPASSSQNLEARVNRGAQLPEGMPPEVASALAQLYGADLQTLAARFHGYADDWLQSALSRREDLGSTTASQPAASGS